MDKSFLPRVASVRAREKFVLPPKNSGNVAAFPEFLCPPHPLGLNFSLALVPDFASRPCTLNAYRSLLVPAEMFTCVVPASVEPRFYPIRLGGRKNRAKLYSFARFFGQEEKPRLRAGNCRRNNLATHITHTRMIVDKVVSGTAEN